MTGSPTISRPDDWHLQVPEAATRNTDVPHSAVQT